LVWLRGGDATTIAPLADVPIAFGGAARHNVANALAAIGVASALGLPDHAIRAGLAAFDGGARSNPGRANVWRLGGVTAIVDFAHNPHGLDALAGLVRGLPADRRALVIGQAGDRSDDDIRAFARSAWAMEPAHVFLKELEAYRRGREPGAVPALLADELERCGAPPKSLSRWPSELEAVRAAVAWARERDLLLLTTHAQRAEVFALLERLERDGWKPGDPLPAAVEAP
jgi:UDP-N-acetylmuramyl tripeptide synthase